MIFRNDGNIFVTNGSSNTADSALDFVQDKWYRYRIVLNLSNATGTVGNWSLYRDGVHVGTYAYRDYDNAVDAIRFYSNYTSDDVVEDGYMGIANMAAYMSGDNYVSSSAEKLAVKLRTEKSDYDEYAQYSDVTTLSEYAAYKSAYDAAVAVVKAPYALTVATDDYDAADNKYTQAQIDDYWTAVESAKIALEKVYRIIPGLTAAKSKYQTMTFGYGTTDYMPEYETEIVNRIETVQAALDTNAEDVVDKLDALTSYMDTLQPNGAEFTVVPDTIRVNGDAYTSLSGLSSAIVSVPLEYKQYVKNYVTELRNYDPTDGYKKVAMTAILYKEGTGGFDYDKVYDVKTVIDENIDPLSEESLNITLDLSECDDKENAKIKLMFFDASANTDIKAMVFPVVVLGETFTQINIEAKSGEIKSEIVKEYTDPVNGIAKLTLTVDAVPDDSVIVKMCDVDGNVEYINQKSTNDEGKAVFTIMVDEADIEGNAKNLPYYIYSAVTGDTISLSYSYKTVNEVNTVFESLYENKADAALAWNIVKDNDILLEIEDKEYFAEYKELETVPQEIVTSITELQYNARTTGTTSWDSFKTDLKNALKSETNVLKYLLAETLIEKYYLDALKAYNAEAYSVYEGMTDEQKTTLYTLIKADRNLIAADLYSANDLKTSFVNNIYKAKYPAGGYLFEKETFEDGANRYIDDYYLIGSGVKTLTSSVAGGQEYILGDETDHEGGLVLWTGTSEKTGKEFDAAVEGTNAKLVVEFDVLFDNFIGQGSEASLCLRVGDFSEYEAPYPYYTYFNGEGVIKAGKTEEEIYSGLENNKWYHIKAVYNQGRTYDLYINGELVKSAIIPHTTAYQKYPCLDSAWLYSTGLTKQDTARINVDNVEVYKTNVNFSAPADKTKLLSEIRKAQYLLNTATYGEKPEDYPSDVKAPLESAVADAKGKYEALNGNIDSWNNAVDTLKVAEDAFVKNGRSLIGLAFEAADAAEVKPLTYAVTPKVSVSRYPANGTEKVTPIVQVIKIVDENTEEVWKTFVGPEQTVTHNGASRETVSLNPVSVNMKGADAPSNYKFRTIIVKNVARPELYTYSENTAAECKTVSVSVSENYSGDDAQIEFTVETVECDNVVITVINESGTVLFADSKVTGADKKAVFKYDAGTTENGDITYNVYSVAANKCESSAFEHYKAITVNDILMRIRAVPAVDGICDTEAVGAIIKAVEGDVDNRLALGLCGGLYDLYLNYDNVSSRVAPAEASEAVWTLLRSADGTNYANAAQLDSFKTTFLQAAEPAAMYALKDKPIALAEILSENTEASLTAKIGIGTDANNYSVETVYRYNKYVNGANKSKVHSFIAGCDKAALTGYENQKKAFDTAVLLALVNAAANNDTITEAIDNSTDILPDGATYKNSKATVKSAAAGFIKAHADFTTLAELNSYIPTALEKGAESLNGTGGDGSGGSGGGGGSLVDKGTIVGQVTPGIQTNVPGQNAASISKMPFVDLEGYDWANTAISVMHGKGILIGKSEKSFAPADNVLREEFVKMAVMLFDISAISNECEFKDVEDGAWYRTYIIAGVENGIINGISDELFGSGQSVNREQLAVIAYNAAKAVGVQFKDETYYVPFADDENVSDYAKTAVRALAASGVINGKGDNIFAPKDFCTRAEAAKVLYGVFMLSYI